MYDNARAGRSVSMQPDKEHHTNDRTTRYIYMRCGYGGKHKIHVPPSYYAGYVVGLGKLADES